MKKSILITVAMMAVSMLANAQLTFNTAASDESTYVLSTFFFKNSSYKVLDTTYSIKDSLPMRTIRSKFKESDRNRSPGKWMMTTENCTWSERNQMFIFYSASIEPYVEPLTYTPNYINEDRFYLSQPHPFWQKITPTKPKNKK
jgi:hypothetical protein